MQDRRQFLKSAAMGAACLAAPEVALKRLKAQTAEARIEILLEEPIGRIAPEIYGHFVEHLGGVVYDGVWVGEKSKIPNTGGLRTELVEALRKVRPGAIRWPGGCFADQYDWKDGIGPREKRPRRTSFWAQAQEWSPTAHRGGAQTYETNEFGVIEFARFCKLTGAQPYFAANVRSLPALEFARWVEYCNAPAGSVSLAEQRAADGERDPLNVRFWGVGNESWGCGGNFLAEDYASEFRRYTAWLPSYGGRLSLIGSGPSSDNLEWTRRFFKKAVEGGVLGGMWGWGLHHYSWNASGGRTSDWVKGKRDALRFDAEQYYEILREGSQLESLINAHWGVMGECDPKHAVKLVVDEWGAWYAGGSEPFQEALLGQHTMADAVLAGLSLDIFNRHAEKVAMANIAQLVNCLQSLFFAHEDRFCLTPTYHVFDMYAAHQGAQAVRTVFLAPAVRYSRNTQPATLAGLAGSASRNGKQLTLTVTNPSLDQAREAEIAIRGGAAQSVRATTLAASDVHAHNSFEAPREVEPKTEILNVRGGLLAHRFPPASVTKLEIGLG